jgi:hypothetical protein
MFRCQSTGSQAARFRDDGFLLIRAMLDAAGIELPARAAHECFTTTTRPPI